MKFLVNVDMIKSKFERKEAFQMLSIIKSAALMGIDSYPVDVVTFTFSELKLSED